MSGKAHSRKNVNPRNCEPECPAREHCIEIKRIITLDRGIFQCPIVGAS